MKIGLLLWEVSRSPLVVFGGLSELLLRSWFSRTEGELRWEQWIKVQFCLK